MVYDERKVWIIIIHYLPFIVYHSSFNQPCSSLKYLSDMFKVRIDRIDNFL